MNTWVKLLRYHLLQRIFVVLPLTWLAFIFAVELVFVAAIPVSHQGAQRDVGGVACVFVISFVAGVLSVARSLPFGLTLGLSRRAYYLGTAGLGLALAVAYGFALTLLQAIERASDGWGVGMHFFRVPFILDGSWYLTWLTASVVLALMFVYGTWFGLVLRRWGLTGLWVFIGCQITLVLVGALLVTWAQAWDAVGRFFATLSATGLTGVLGMIAVVLLVGGYATMRRVAV